MKKRLRFFITTLNTGGAERVLMNLLAILDPDEYDITLLTVFGGSNESRIPPYVHYRSILKNTGAVSSLLGKIIMKLPPKVFASRFLKDDYDYEVAYLEGIPTAFVAAKKTCKKKIAFIHCDLSVNKINYTLYRDTERCLNTYRSFDRVCFVSNDALTGFERAIGVLDNASVIHNAINVTAVRQGAEQPIEEEYAAKGLKLVTVGRLAPEKNFRALATAVAELSKNHDIELWIIGDGEERAALEEIKAKAQTDRIRLLGYIENPYPYVKKADLYVCSSVFEGYNTSVLESVIIGTPVLTTDCAGMSEILDNGRYGMIVDNSAEGLKSGIKLFAEDLGMLSAYRNNLAGFSPETLPYVREYQELFT